MSEKCPPPPSSILVLNKKDPRSGHKKDPRSGHKKDPRSGHKKIPDQACMKEIREKSLKHSHKALCMEMWTFPFV